MAQPDHSDAHAARRRIDVHNPALRLGWSHQRRQANLAGLHIDRQIDRLPPVGRHGAGGKADAGEAGGGGAEHIAAGEVGHGGRSLRTAR